jgi:2,3-dimethylmalate lyase
MQSSEPPAAPVTFRAHRRRLCDVVDALDGRMLVIVGVANGAEARLLHHALSAAETADVFPDVIGGFVTFVSGFLSAADRGLPDLGYVLRDDIARTVDVVEQATWLAALDTGTPAWPLGADIDTGYGNEPSAVLLTCRQMHKQGASYVQIEDQYGINKSCGHLDGARGSGKSVLGLDEMLDVRLRPSLAYAAEQDDFMVMGRTDALGPLGIDEALRRADAFAEAGAQMVFIEAPQSDAELERIGEAFRGTSVLNAANVVEGSSKTPAHSVRELHAMGFGMAMFPVGARLLAAAGLSAYYEVLATSGDPSAVTIATDASGRFERYNRALGRDHLQAWNRWFGG